MLTKGLCQFDILKYVDMAFFVELKKKNLYSCKQAMHNQYLPSS